MSVAAYHSRSTLFRSIIIYCESCERAGGKSDSENTGVIRRGREYAREIGKTTHEWSRRRFVADCSVRTSKSR